MVAAVVPFESERYLWIVGGRDEHARQTMAELFTALTSRSHDRRSHDRRRLIDAVEPLCGDESTT